MPVPDTPALFIAKWSPVTLPERASTQEHFLDLCHLLGQPTPAEADATGAEYTFEKGVAVTGPAPSRRGSVGVPAGETRGFADVWWRGKFGWEYKRKNKYKTLDEAYRQLCQYREALENPPLLIVSDIARIQIHTNFTGTRKEVHEIRLEHIGHPDNLAKLRRVFDDPHSFKPTLTTSLLTESAAAEFAKIADQLRQRNCDPHDAAHFLMKCMFCLFAEDVKLLPEKLFTKLLQRYRGSPDKLTDRLAELFRVMGSGGDFGADAVAYFNGGLFDEAPPLALSSSEINAMLIAAEFDWGAVEPSIFGTLFERSLDPSKRSQIGAHYTSREDIMLIVEPVVMAPLRREWDAVTAEVEKLLVKRRSATAKSARKKADDAIAKTLDDFLHRLATIRILDPACGSGNFLYVAIQELLSLEKDVIIYASRPEIGQAMFPRVRPTQLHGIEINPYAAELAQVVIWIGYLQWMRDNGFAVPRDPILAPLQTIECRDAILDFGPPTRVGGSDSGAGPSEPRTPVRGQARPATWPEADFIIGNPPFLGSKLFRQYGLDEDYIQALYGAYDLPKSSDLCCYWFEQARQAVAGAAAFRPRGEPDGAAAFRPRGTPARRERRGSARVGLLATQGIRGGDNRTVLEHIKQTGDIFMAWSDRDWILDGANVHVSMIGFDDGAEQSRMLDGRTVAQINMNLTALADLTAARSLPENSGIYVRSPEKGAKFEIPCELALKFLRQPNPNGRLSIEVLHPWVNGEDLVDGRASYWIIDFHLCATEREAAGFEAPFQYVSDTVRGLRSRNSDPRMQTNWWRFRRSGEGVRGAAARFSRLLGTTMVSKYRLFRWIDPTIQPDKTIPVFARSDDYFFGVLHSSIHELWARRMGTQLREVESGFRYTPTTCFETFPLPWLPGAEPRPSGRAEVPRDVNVAAHEPRDSSRADDASRDAAVAGRDLAFGATYLLTWTTYGTWLPGDERGFVGRVPGGAGGHTIHNEPGQPYDADDERLRRAARARMKGAAVHLEPDSARVCAAAFRQVADRYNIGIHAGAIMATHVHLVVTAADAEPSRLLNLFKGVSSRRLGQSFGPRAAGAWWTRGGSYRSLVNDRAIRAATDYVRAQPSALEVFDHAPEPRPSGRAEVPRDVNVAAHAYERISAAAQELNDHRERWLNPPEWIADWGRVIDARDKFEDVPGEARPLIRHSAIMAEAARDPRFKKRTLTELYNERPTWLKLAHEQLDRAVLAAYAAVDPDGGWSEDLAAVWTDTGAGQPLPDDHPVAAQRKEIDQRVLANLLRLNLDRAAPPNE